MFEVIQGNTGNVEKLIEKGADVNCMAADRSKFTPLHYAVIHGHPDMIKLLAKHHADFKAADGNGYSAAHTCVIYKKPECLETLIALNAPIDLPGAIEGLTPLYYAVTDNQPETVKLLIENGCNTDITSHDGSSLLHKAAFYGYADVCRILLEKGLKPDLSDKAGKTAIDIARQFNEKACIDILSGAEKNRSGI